MSVEARGWRLGALTLLKSTFTCLKQEWTFREHMRLHNWFYWSYFGSYKVLLFIVKYGYKLLKFCIFFNSWGKCYDFWLKLWIIINYLCITCIIMFIRGGDVLFNLRNIQDRRVTGNLRIAHPDWERCWDKMIII